MSTLQTFLILQFDLSVGDAGLSVLVALRTIKSSGEGDCSRGRSRVTSCVGRVGSGVV
jgi:hypothetical protein